MRGVCQVGSTSRVTGKHILGSRKGMEGNSQARKEKELETSELHEAGILEKLGN